MTEEKVIKNQSKTEVSKKVEDAKSSAESSSSNEKILTTKNTEEKNLKKQMTPQIYPTIRLIERVQKN